MKSFFTKELTIFTYSLRLITLIMLIGCSALATHAAINIILIFSTGPFYIMCLWIFIFTIHITIVTYYIFWDLNK